MGGFNVGAVCLPKPSESECGDAWAVAVRDDRTLILVADGLGHGFAAAEASRSAVRLFNEHTSLDPLALVTVLHAGLRSTRGAAVAVAEIRATDGTVRFVGVGNISALLASPTASRSMVSHNGTAGVEARRIQEFVYPGGRVRCWSYTRTASRRVGTSRATVAFRTTTRQSLPPRSIAITVGFGTM